MEEKINIEEITRAAQAHYNEREYAQALPLVQKLIELGENSAQMRVYEAQCLYYSKRAPEAAVILRELISQDAKNIHYPLILSQYERATGNFDESYRLLENVPDDTPGYPTLMGWHRMRQGRFLEAFGYFEREPGIIQLAERLRLPPEKMLKKTDEVRGKVVLYLMEGGFGDEVLFSRFAKALEDRGARVIVGASRRILEILKNNLYVKQARAVEEISPAEYDYCLPAVKCVTMLGIQDPMKGFAFPYMFADESEIQKWKPIIEKEAAGRKKIGIHWQGNWAFDNVEMKSPPAHLMLKFAELGRLFSLQRDAEGNALPPGSPVFDAEAGAPSWASTAAVIREMDYIVTNDTSTAHLAGALGKKTLVLVQHAPHFYWAMHETQAIWYPEIYTFRQPAYNDWPGAIDAAYQWIKNHE